MQFKERIEYLTKKGSALVPYLSDNKELIELVDKDIATLNKDICSWNKIGSTIESAGFEDERTAADFIKQIKKINSQNHHEICSYTHIKDILSKFPGIDLSFLGKYTAQHTFKENWGLTRREAHIPAFDIYDKNGNPLEQTITIEGKNSEFYVFKKNHVQEHIPQIFREYFGNALKSVSEESISKAHSAKDYLPLLSSNSKDSILKSVPQQPWDAERMGEDYQYKGADFTFEYVGYADHATFFYIVPRIKNTPIEKSITIGVFQHAAFEDKAVLVSYKS